MRPQRGSNAAILCRAGHEVHGCWTIRVHPGTPSVIVDHPYLSCDCSFTAEGETWEEVGRLMDAHLTEVRRELLVAELEKSEEAHAESEFEPEFDDPYEGEGA